MGPEANARMRRVERVVFTRCIVTSGSGQLFEIKRQHQLSSVQFLRKDLRIARPPLYPIRTLACCSFLWICAIPWQYLLTRVNEH